MDKKKIKVLVIKNHHNISKIIENIWRLSENRLKKLGYSFEYHYVSYENTKQNEWLDNQLSEIKENKIDIILWPLLISNFNSNNIFFSDSIVIEKQLILYTKNFKIKGIEMYYLDLFKFWIPFIIILIILSLVMTLIFTIFFNPSSTFKTNYFRFLHSSFLSNKNLYLSNKQNKFSTFIYFIFCSVIFYISYIFLHAVTSAKSILYTSPNKEIYDSIRGSKILLNKYDKINISKVISQGGVIHKSDKKGIELLRTFLDGNGKYDGVLIHSIDINNYNFKNDTIYFKDIKTKLNIAKNTLGFSEYCLPINKERKDLQKIINTAINEVVDNNLDLLCKHRTNKYNDTGFYINIPCSI